ncbi:MAG: SMI1/KNR4 family protein [Betaproteobacteria bacterium]
MFRVPKEMLAYWEETAEPKATAADIAMIEAAVSAKLALPYVEFVTQFGFVLFSVVPGMRNVFDYALRYPDRMEVQAGDIRCLVDPKQLIEGYQVATGVDSPDDGLPQFPPNYLPVGDAADQSCILLELSGDHPGRVWYWPENEDAWGRGTNVALGFVAENFYDFINRLRPWEDE